jgi:tRNA wybutosine-synthesizing protein 1
MKIRHCALSLVGEPIMYPHINELIDLLHSKQISSFLVTNAQFPDEIKSLEPVTQLYVSVDAATKESLKKIDRPLFRDFWERFLACLRALKDKVKINESFQLFLKYSFLIGSKNSISINIS